MVGATPSESFVSTRLLGVPSIQRILVIHEGGAYKRISPLHTIIHYFVALRPLARRLGSVGALLRTVTPRPQLLYNPTTIPTYMK